MAFFLDDRSLDDRSARIEATAYSEVYQLHRERLVKDRIVIVEGRLAQDDGTGAPVMRVAQTRPGPPPAL